MQFSSQWFFIWSFRSGSGVGWENCADLNVWNEVIVEYLLVVYDVGVVHFEPDFEFFMLLSVVDISFWVVGRVRLRSNVIEISLRLVDVIFFIFVFFF